MVDLGTGLAALGTAEVSKDALGKMLGPTADYIGDGVRAWTEKRVANVQRVFARAHAQLGDQIEQPGAIPPRVLGTVLQEAQFADDELMAAYLGGVLASSRSETGRDDRAAAVAQQIASLSTYAIRTHYLIYAGARPHQIDNSPEVWRSSSTPPVAQVYLTTDSYCEAMEFSSAELTHYSSLLVDTMLALERSGFGGQLWSSGTPPFLRTTTKLARRFPKHGLIFQLTQAGIVLFCIAHGIRDDPFTAFMGKEYTFAVQGAPPPPDVKPVTMLPLTTGDTTHTVASH
jgi:hypothetical protein